MRRDINRLGGVLSPKAAFNFSACLLLKQLNVLYLAYRKRQEKPPVQEGGGKNGVFLTPYPIPANLLTR